MNKEPLKKIDGRSPEASLCLVTPYPPSLTETFIRAHAEGLPAKVVLLHSWRPTVGERTVLSLPRRVFYKALRVINGSGIERETTAAYLKAFRRYKIDAVLAEYGTTGVMVMEACRRARIPLIVHFHGFDASVRTFLEENARTYPLMFKEAAAVIAVSNAMRRKLIELGAPPSKVHYNPCGVDCREFSCHDAAQAPPVFLAVGSFREKKAPQLTLKAFAETHRVCPEARLRMIGEGALLSECVELARDLSLGDAVTFLGGQPHTIVVEEMRGARCFVQHSIEAASGDCEGTPVAVLEAGASGLPVVSTRHAGIPDVVIEEQTGLLVDERDVPGMAAHMIRLVREPELAGRLGRAARERIETNFSMEQSLQRLWTIIDSCIATRHDGVTSTPLVAES